MDYINIGLRSYLIILFISTLSFIEASNINCNGKAFHCVNSTHFKICVDLGGGVSKTVDEFLIPCPQNTVCKPDNLFECEYELTTTLSPVTMQSEVTNKKFRTSDNPVSEKLDITTLFPTKPPQGMVSSERNYNEVNPTSASFTKILLTNAVVTPVPTSNPNDLYTSVNSDKNKNLNLARSTDKELRLSTTESGMNVTQTLPYNVDTFVTSIGVSTNYKIESPVFFSITNDSKGIDPIKEESLEPLNKNSLDLDARLTMTERTDQVSNVSELRYLAPVTSLPGKFIDSPLQENTSQTSTINRLITSENTSQEPNLDLLITYNTTQINKFDNNTQYRNTDIEKQNSTTLNVITNKILTSKKSNINNKSKVNTTITPIPLGQHLAEITTASTIKDLGTSNPIPNISLNAADPIETYLNITTNLEKISITDRDIMISTSTIQPETSIIVINDMSSQITKSEFNYDVSSTALTNLYFNEYSKTPSNKLQRLKSIPDLTSKNETRLKPIMSTVATDLDNNDISSKTLIKNITVEISNQVTSSKSIKDLITKNDTLLKPVTAAGATDLDNNNVTTTEVSNNITPDLSNGAKSLNSMPEFISMNKTLLTPVMVTVATDIDNNNVTTTEVSNNITADLSNGAKSLNSMPEFISMNETLLEPVTAVVDTDLDSNNVTTIGVSGNITVEIPNGVENLKSKPDLISKNETLLKPVTAAVVTDLDNNNVTTTEVSNNITLDLSNGAKSLNSMPEFISMNKTLLTPVMVTVATDIDNNNVTTTEVSNNITSEIPNGVKSLESIPDLILNNGTLLKPVTGAVATDLDNNNVTTTEVSNNITKDISNGVTSFKSIQDLISKNETLLKPGPAAVAADNNNVTTKEVSNNITAEISKGVTSLKTIPALISKNATRLRPLMSTVATDLDDNNVTTIEASNNITAEISNEVARLKTMPDLISKNETRLKQLMFTIATDLDDNNVTTIGVSDNITVEIPNGVKSLESIPDLISKNETAVVTNLDNNNVTTTEVSNNITADLSNGAKSLNSMPEFISMNETLLEPLTAVVVTDLDNNNVTTMGMSGNITVEIPNGVENLKSKPDLISKNETLLKPVTAAVVTDLDNNNVTTIEVSNNITVDLSNGAKSLNSMPEFIFMNETLLTPVMVTVATDIDNNVTTTVVSNNITKDISNGVTSFKSLQDLIFKNETLLKSVTAAVVTDLNNNNVTTTEVNNNITADTSNGAMTLKSIQDLISKNETRLKPGMAIVATDLYSNKITNTEVSNNITAKKFNGVTSLKPIPDIVLGAVSPDDNSNMTITEVSNNMTVKTSNKVTSLKSIQDLIWKNETLLKPVVAAVATDHDNNNVTTAKSTLTTKHSTYFYTDMYSKPLISLERTTMTSESVKENNTKQEIHKNTSSSDNILDKNRFGNQTKRKTEDILMPKSRNTYDFNLSPALNLTYTNNNITDKNNSSLKGTKLKQIQDTNSLLGKSLTVGVIHTDLSFTDKNAVSSVASKSKSIPLVNLRSSSTKSPLPDIYTTSHSYFRENISQTSKFDTTTASNKFHDNKVKESIQTNKNGHVISNIEHEGNKAVYLELIPKQLTKTAVKVNDTTLKEHYNFSDPSLTIGGNVKHDLIRIIGSVNNFSEIIFNNRKVVNTTVGATAIKTFIRVRNVSEVKNVSVIRTKNNYADDLNVTSESNITASNLLRNTSNQANSMKNKIHEALPSNAFEDPRIPSDVHKSSQPTKYSKLKTTSSVSNTKKLEIVTISNHTNRGNGNEKNQMKTGHSSPLSILTIGNAITKNNRNNTQNSFTTINNINNYKNPSTNQEFSCTKRGKFSDTKDCHKFYVCIGRGKPITGVCPTDTVFSEYLKQCTKNVTHCIRNNQFKCTASGRFVNILCNNSYFICAKKNSGFIRFTLHCQKGYYLDKNNIKCATELKNISKSDESSSKNTKELSFDKSKEIKVTVKSKNVFECEKEGKFNDPQDCRTYYVCEKGRKSIFRRKIKKCDSDEVFHKKKKKCVDVESYDCDI